MEIIYKNEKLKYQCTSIKQAKKDFPEKDAVKLIQRIQFINDVETLMAVINSPRCNFHGLKGKLSDYYAIDINGRKSPYRLKIYIKGYSREEVFKNPSCITKIKIMEVSKHYE